MKERIGDYIWGIEEKKQEGDAIEVGLKENKK